ncbi:MAG: Zn-dependent hydrolase [Acidobacteria bacterium]|nr:Zn-dependent hydrolase [Acidobacteriota bacterium]
MDRREFNRKLAAAAAAACPLISSVAAGGSLQSGGRRYSINPGRLRSHLEGLARFGRTAEGGVSRVAWSRADIDAREWVMESLMKPAGLEVRIDPAGSIFGRRPGTEAALPVILFGSHTDSVSNGGNFDGPLGTLAAIEVMQGLADHNIVTRHPLECVVWSNEEGEAYGRGLFGSRAMVGAIEPGELDETDENGVHIRDAVRGIGGDISRIAEARRKPGEIAAYLELHIEQGGVLDKEGLQIGVVEGIVGIVRYQVEITGSANHAGTTPMPDRRDALVAASRLVLAVREETMREPGRQVGTVGKLGVEPGVPNVIPGRVHLVIEQRDLSLEKVEQIHRRIAARAAEIGRESGARIEIRKASSHEPALSTPWLRELIEHEAAQAGFSTLVMPSGAGHDAQMAARIAPMGMIFAPSVGGISHSPRELTRWEDVTNSCEVLYRSVLAIDRR